MHSHISDTNIETDFSQQLLNVTAYSWRYAKTYSDNEVVFRRDLHECLLAIGKAQNQ